MTHFNCWFIIDNDSSKFSFNMGKWMQQKCHVNQLTLKLGDSVYRLRQTAESRSRNDQTSLTV